MTTPPTPEESIIFSTMKIRPEDYSPIRAGSRWHAFLYSVAGVLYIVRHQRSIQWLIVISVACIGLGLWLQIELALMVEMILVIGTVWITETLNTAIEAAVDVASPEYHPMAKVSKDVAAGANLIASFLALLITAMILLPPLVERLRG